MNNLADMLVYADIDQLHRMAKVYDCTCNSNSKHELIQAIMTTIHSKTTIQSQVETMSLEELRFVNALLFEVNRSYSLEDLLAKAQQSKVVESTTPAGELMKVGKEPLPRSNSSRELISKLRSRGFLFNGHREQTKYLFHVPKDMQQAYKKILHQQFMQQLVWADVPTVIQDEQRLLSEDITITLQFIKEQDVMLIADGSMYKRYLTMLLSQLHMEEQLPTKVAWRFGYGRHFNHYPDRFTLLYDYCISQSYISEHMTGKLMLLPAGEARLLQGTTGEIANKWKAETMRMYVHWIKIYKKAISNIQAIVHWTVQLADRWVTLESVVAVLLPFVNDFYYEHAVDVIEKRIIKPMIHLGLLQLGHKEELGNVIKITALSKTIVQT